MKLAEGLDLNIYSTVLIKVFFLVLINYQGD